MANILREKPEPLELRLRAGRLWWLKAWLPVLLAILMIARESTQLFGANHTSLFLRPLFEAIFGPLRDELWDHVHLVIRKSGHFGGYGLVCLTFLRAWLLTLARTADLSRSAWRLRSVLLAVLGTFCVASGDEWHQTFLPNRTGAFSDVLLDTTGASVVILLVWLVFWRRRRGRRSRATPGRGRS